MDILVALLVLSIIVLIHELGHFMAARFFKMPVKEFAIGMGTPIYTVEGENTDYSIRAIPMGGYVSIEGMEVDSKVEDGFNTKSPFARFVVLSAGVVMNFLTAFIFTMITLFMSGKIIQDNSPVVGSVNSSVKAAKVLQVNDKILTIAGKKVENWENISLFLKEYQLSTEFLDKSEKDVTLEIERDGKVVSLPVPMTFEEKENRYLLGITPLVKSEKYKGLDLIKDSTVAFKNIFKETLGGFKLLVTGKVSPKELSGPVGIVRVVGEASRGGLSIILWLMVMLSINVGIFNLLPLPALDGGRLIFILLEIIGVKIDKKLEERVHIGGMVVLLLFILIVTGNDILNMFR